MKSNKRKDQQSKKRAAKELRISRPGGKSRYARKQISGSRYWERTSAIREGENIQCAIRMAARDREYRQAA